MTDKTTQLRALFLAALMVLSVVVGTVALGGTAAAIGTDNPEINESFDAAANSGSVRWVGQDLYVANSSSDSGTYALRRVSGSNNDQLGTVATEITLNSNGAAVFSTSNLESDQYVITNDQGQVVQVNSTGVVTQTGASISAAQFTLSDQTLSAEFNESQVSTEGEDTVRALEVDSNRGDYTVEIGAEGLDEDDLVDIFGDNIAGTVQRDVGDDSQQLGTFTDDGQDFIRVRASTNTDLTADFADVSAGSYNFSLEVTDTAETANANIEVVEQDADRTFANAVVHEAAGDIAEVTIDLESTDDAVVFLGGAQTNVLERIELEDGNDDGQITFKVNTYLAGREPGSVAGFDSIDDAYSSEEDDVGTVTRPRSTDGTVTTTQGLASNPEGTLDINENLSAPLEPGEYRMIVSSNTNYDVNDNDNLQVPGEDGTAVLDLAQGSVSNVQTWTAPDNENIDELDEVADAASQSTTVAEDDYLIVQMEAAGIEGIVNDEVPAEFKNNEGLNLVIRERNAGANQNPMVLNLSGGNAYSVVKDAQNDTYYMVIDTSDPATIDPTKSFDSGAYQVDFFVTGEGTDVYDNELADWYDIPQDQVTANPYLDNDEIRSASTQFTLENRRAEFTGLNDEGVLEVPASQNATVTGQTNLASGTSVTVRLAGEDTLYSRSIQVGDNGTVEAQFDLSGAEPGQNLTAQIRRSGTSLASADAVVGQATNQTPTSTPTNQTPTETGTPTDTPGTSTGTPATETPTPTPQPATETETTTGDGPGFGAVVALVALLAAALLAVRRD